MTAAELALALGIGQSTAARRLAALEVAGSARRAPGGRLNGTRVADRWSAVDPSLHGVAAPIPKAAKARPKAAEAGPAGTGAAADDNGRLRRGALGALVLGYLSERPSESFGPSALGKALGRSQGAVSNSLATMAARGEIELVGDKPRRYRAAS